MHFLVKYVSLAAVITLTGMGLPIPEEVLVIGAGIAANGGAFEPWAALATCLVGAVAGDCASYAIGYHFGRALLRDRHWFSRLLTVEREQWVEKRFQEHGLKAFLGLRFLVGVRSPIYITAGILRISFRKFVLVDAISAAMVVSLFFGLSYIFTESFRRLWDKLHGVEIALTVVAVVATLAAGGYYVWRRRQKKTDAVPAAAAGAAARPASNPEGMAAPCVERQRQTVSDRTR